MNLDRRIAKGNTADVYLCDGKAVKVFHDRLPGTEAAYEANKQQLAFSCGLPVPRIFEVTHIGGKQAILMEYIEGTTFGDVMLNHRGQAEAYMARSVAVQLEIHSHTIAALESMRDKLTRQIQTANALEHGERAKLLERLGRMPVESRLCHGDFHVFNLIQTENKAVIIDWVDASAGSPCADVCRTYVLYAGFSSEWADGYLRLYCDQSGITQGDVFAWLPIIAGARLSESIPAENTNRLLQIVREYA